MPKILVTGGAGFIGSALVKRLQRVSHEVFVLDNLSFGRRDFVSVPDDHFFQEDLLNAGAITSIVKAIDPDWVLHLAAIHFIPYCNQHPLKHLISIFKGHFICWKPFNIPPFRK
ncbi:MAG: NAD-dependent epimerase/dehydratase family protein [Spirosomataceae bacterium]